MTPVDYCNFRSNPANDYVTDGVWAINNGIKIDDLQAWKAANPAEVEKILAARRARYADEMIQIDSALLRKAKAGDARSIQLAWARFENWSPKIEEEASKKTGGRNKTLAELISEGG
jgi:hypothetical protein